MRLRSLGRVDLPIVVRIPFGGGIGAVEHHSESPEACSRTPAGCGWWPAPTPADAYTMIQQASQ